MTWAGLAEGVVYSIRHTTLHEQLQDNGTSGTDLKTSNPRRSCDCQVC